MNIQAKANPEYLEMVNRLLVSATPVGAYALGALSALAWQTEFPPDELLLGQALDIEKRSPRIPAIQEVFDNWEAAMIMRAARRNGGVYETPESTED